MSKIATIEWTPILKGVGWLALAMLMAVLPGLGWILGAHRALADRERREREGYDASGEPG
jgi:hypothetical protein